MGLRLLQVKWHLLGVALLLAVSVEVVFTPSSSAKISDFMQAQVQSVQVNPADNSVWVLWTDNSQVTHVNHFYKDGQLMQTFDLSNSNGYTIGLDFNNGKPRYYYTILVPSYLDPSQRPVQNIGYLDLNTDITGTLASSVDFSACRPVFGYNLLYNPANQHLYFNCDFQKSVDDYSVQGAQAYVLDLKTDKITNRLPYRPLAFNPVNRELYATRTYTISNQVQPLPFSDFLAVDAKNEQFSSATPLAQKLGPYAYIRSLNVSTRTGHVWLVTGTCFAKCSFPAEYEFDADGNKLKDGVLPPVEEFRYLNETTYKLYGTQFLNYQKYIAVDASNTDNGQVASFNWIPVAVDSAQNRVYAVTPPVYYNDNMQHGLGLLVMNGTNYDIIQYLKLSPPDPKLTQYATPIGALPINFNGSYFKETGHTLSGKFLDYWNSHGGLAVFGFPITEPFQEATLTGVFTVQYFERNRFELHPELAGTPFEVELGLLGQNFSAQTGPKVTGQYSSGQAQAIQNGLLFLQTGHTLTGKFLEYWNGKGGLAIFGLPLTEPFMETSPIDGKTYLVQYFERNRFELHPELAGTPYEVELGLLGSQLLKSMGWPV